MNLHNFLKNYKIDFAQNKKLKKKNDFLKYKLEIVFNKKNN